MGNKIEHSGLMPPPPRQVGWLFRLIVVSFALILGLFGCGIMFTNYKQEKINILGYDPEQRSIEMMINDVYRKYGEPIPYPKWDKIPESKWEKWLF